VSINQKDMRMLVSDVLTLLEPEIPYSEAAIELLIMTIAHESKGGYYLEQVRGPAVGVVQIEPDTAEDIWINYLNRKPAIADKILQFIPNTKFESEQYPAYENKFLWQLRVNLAYQVALARVHYWRVPEALPDERDIKGLAQYYKKYYNTYQGSADPERVIEDYYNYVKWGR